MLLLCEWTTPVWFGLGIIKAPTSSNIKSFKEWLSDCILGNNHPYLLSKAEISGIFVTLWNIWKERNRLVHCASPVDPISTLISSKLLWKEYTSVPIIQPNEECAEFQVTRSATVFQKHTQNRWRAPVKGRSKINVDASWEKKGRAFAGIVCRNNKGEVEFMQYCALYAGSALMAEALAMREAITAASNLGCLLLCLESDCLLLIQACRGKAQVGEIAGVVNDIKVLASSFDACGFTWVGREGNKAAHVIASLAKSNNLQQNWCREIPIELVSALEMDKQGCS